MAGERSRARAGGGEQQEREGEERAMEGFHGGDGNNGNEIILWPLTD